MIVTFKFITSMTACQSAYSPRTPIGERTELEELSIKPAQNDSVITHVLSCLLTQAIQLHSQGFSDLS